MYNQDMKYTTSHEWVKIIADNVVAVGITHHAQELLGDLVFIELPTIGSNVGLNDVVGVVESVKAASDLYSPVNGEVIEINNAVVDDPTLANSDPQGQGWLFKAKLDDTTQLNNLMSADEYASSIGVE